MVKLGQWFSTVFGPGTIFKKKYPMDHFAVLTAHEQLVESVLQIGFYQGFMKLSVDH